MNDKLTIAEILNVFGAEPSKEFIDFVAGFESEPVSDREHIENGWTHQGVDIDGDRVCPLSVDDE